MDIYFIRRRTPSLENVRSQYVVVNVIHYHATQINALFILRRVEITFKYEQYEYKS